MGQRKWKVPVAVVGVLTAFIAPIAIATGADLTSAQTSAPVFELRGMPANVGQFSLTTLHDAAMMQELEDARVDVFDTCMAERGFKESPTASPDAGTDEYTLAFEEAAYGPRAWDIGPPLVRLPDGSTSDGGVVWQPGSCAYAQDAVFGTDPYLREALRYRVMMLRLEADQETIADPAFGRHFDNWAQCSGNSDAVALLEALDPPSLAIEDIRPGRRNGSIERRCVTAEAGSDLRAIRGLHHARTAEESLAIVDAWVELIDLEASAVASAAD